MIVKNVSGTPRAFFDEGARYDYPVDFEGEVPDELAEKLIASQAFEEVQ